MKKWKVVMLDGREFVVEGKSCWSVAAEYNGYSSITLAPDDEKIDNLEFTDIVLA